MCAREISALRRAEGILSFGVNEPLDGSIISFIKRFNFVTCMGLPCTGKSAFQDILKNDRRLNPHTCSFWDRSVIQRMIFSHKEDPTFYPLIRNFELSIFPKILNETYHILFYEGWMLTPSGRQHLVRLAAPYASLLLVFDGPPGLVADRYALGDLDRENRLDQLYDSVQWPNKAREPWSCIVYVNSFGEAGREYLKDTVVI